MTDIGEMDAVELAAHIAQGDTSPFEVVSAAIEACERLNPDLNVLCSQRFDRPLKTHVPSSLVLRHLRASRPSSKTSVRRKLVNRVTWVTECSRRLGQRLRWMPTSSQK